MMNFFKKTMVVFGLIIATSIIAAIAPNIGVWVGVILLAVPLFAIFKPLPRVGLNHRGFSFLVAVLVGFPATMLSVGLLSSLDTVRLAELKENDPVAYLSELRVSDDGEWLAELAEMDPEQHAAELASIAEEKEQREAEEQAAASARRAESEARRAEEAKARVTAHVEQLERELASMPSVSATKYTGSVEDINTALIIIGAWSLLYEEGASLPLDADGENKRQRFRELLVRKQIAMFPALRDAYGPAMRKQLWEADGSARTIGTGYRTVEFVSATFARNANIKQIHTEIYENLMMLRFTRAQYKWIRQASEFSYYTLKSPRDSEIVSWSSNGRFRLIN